MNQYNAKIQRFKTTVNHKEPDKIPILGLFGTWVWEYGGLKAKDAIEDVEKEMKAYDKVIYDFPVDGLFYVGEGRSMKMYDVLGTNSYFFSSDGVTLQHKEVTMLRDDEINDLAENFLEYSYNELFKRKYPNLNYNDKKSYQCLKDSILEMMKEWDRCDQRMAHMKEKDIPVTTSVFTHSPMDYLFDYYRGFSGIATDLRRNSEAILNASNALADLIIKLFDTIEMPVEYPYCWTPLHLPTFINAKQFEKLYWPSFQKVYNYLFSRGVKVMFYAEGKWKHLFPFLRELPKDSAIILIENDDIFDAKKRIGDVVTIAGGINTETLKYGSKETCIESAKKLIDICGPGGGYICSTNKILISGKDVDPQNMQATFEYINEHGKY